MRFLGLGRIAVSGLMVSAYWVAGAGNVSAAINLDVGSAQSGITLTGGKLVVGFATNTSFLATTLDRIDQISWSGGSGAMAGKNFIPSYDNGYCNDATVFFGEAEAIIIPGSTALASLQTGTSFTSTTNSLDCNGNVRGEATASTAYDVYPGGDSNENEFRVQRTLNFTGRPPTFANDYVRAYMPALSQTYFIVNYPNAAGTEINSVDNTQCNSSPCEITDWNGKWFAEDDDSGNGMVVFRDLKSTTPAELVILFDSESYTNLTSIGLFQPNGGWTGLVTEVEWVCFYDTSTWSSADQRMGNLPQGCAQAAADTIPDAFGFIAVTGVAPSSVQTSNTVSISGITAPAAASIVGGSYSINDGAFTTAPGSINNGDTVTVQGTASASFATSTSVTLTIGGVSSTFSIATASPAPTVSISIDSTAVTLGQAAHLTWTTMNATACTASGAWTGTESTSGSVAESPASAGAFTYALSCTGPGGTTVSSSKLTVTAPAVVSSILTGHAGGGGGLDGVGLLGLAGLALMRLQRVRKYFVFILINGTGLLGAASLHAQESNAIASYVGMRAGWADYQLSPADLDKALGSGASQIDSVSISRHQFGGALYGGVPVYRNLMLELSYAQFGQFPLAVRTTSTNDAALEQRTVHALQPAGHGVTAGFMLPVNLTSRVSVEPRVSALFYESTQELSTSAASYEDKEHGFGVDAGLSLAVRAATPLHIGIGVDCMHMTQACNVLVISAQLEYRFLH